MSTATIRLKDLELSRFTAKMRRANKGRTCQLAAMSERPVLALDCSKGRSPSQLMREEARLHGQSVARLTPLDRGHIARLMEHTQLMHGGREVRKTWGKGIRALLSEGSKYTLQGGAA